MKDSFNRTAQPSGQGNVVMLSRVRRTPAQSNISGLRSTFWQMWQKIERFLTIAGSRRPELKVYLQRDRFGNTWWTAYHPVTGKEVRFWSQTDLLAWITKHHS